MGGPFATAISHHPVSAHAVGEVIGEVIERLGRHPDLAMVFVTPGHAGALEDIGGAVRALLSPTVLLGAVSSAVIGDGSDVGSGPAVALWCGMPGPVAPVMFPGPVPEPVFDASGAILLGDTDPVAGFTLASALPLAGGVTGRGGLLVQDRVLRSGAVGALVGPAVRVQAVASEGTRPVGGPMVVTGAERSIVYELDGRPAYQQLLAVVADRMPAEDVRLVNAGLRLSTLGAGGERLPAPTRAVLGVDRSNDALGLDDPVPTGSLVRFEVRDPDAAAADLRAALTVLDDGGVDGALLFRAESRSPAWFGSHGPDVAVCGAALGAPALAGCATTSEVGPVIGRPGPWRHTAVVMTFAGSAGEPAGGTPRPHG